MLVLLLLLYEPTIRFYPSIYRHIYLYSIIIGFFKIALLFSRGMCTDMKSPFLSLLGHRGVTPYN